MPRYVLVSALVLCIAGIVLGDIQFAHYKMIHGSANLDSQDLISSSDTPSKIACGWRCIQESMCVSFKWYTNISLCELFSVYASYLNISAYIGGDYYAYVPRGHVCDVADPCQNQGVCIPSGPDVYFCDCPGHWCDQNCTTAGGQPKIVSADVVGPSNNRTMSLPIITEDCTTGQQAPAYVVLMRRQDGSVNFYRNWIEYKEGFGDLNGEFWIGNENMHYLTNNGTNHKLRVDLRRFSGGHGYAEYDHFSVGPETDKYRLILGSYLGGTAGDPFTYHNAMQFTTLDSDNDLFMASCTVQYTAAWWHRDCFDVQLTALYSPGPVIPRAMGVIWNTFADMYESLAFAEMKLYV